VEVNGKAYDWAVWGESLEPGPGVTPLATYLDQFYKSKVAAITRKLGNGTVTYIGVESLGGDLERDLMRGVFERAKVGVRNLPKGFQVDWRRGFCIARNLIRRTARWPHAP